MSWKTIYIAGRPGFEKDVLHHLQQSDFDFMPGSSGEHGPSLYWIPEKANLRDFKKAIGGKTVFKYRLQFHDTVEEFIETKNNEPNQFTPKEKEMIRLMNAWEKAREI